MHIISIELFSSLDKKLRESLQKISLSVQQKQTIDETLYNIEQLMKDSIEVSVKHILAGNSSQFPALKALVSVLKNPAGNRINNFADELEKFKYTMEEKRAAWLYFSALNGMECLAGNAKGDMMLNRLCEMYAYGQAPGFGLMKGGYSYCKYTSIIPTKKSQLITQDSGYPLELKPVIRLTSLRIRLLSALQRKEEWEKIQKILELRLKKRANTLLIWEYRIPKKLLISDSEQDWIVIQTENKLKEIKVLNLEKFRREWLPDNAEFEKKFSREKNIYLEMYQALVKEPII